MSRPFWKEPLPSQLQDHQVIPHDGGVYDGGDDQMQQKLTLQEMLQEKRRNESNYLQVHCRIEVIQLHFITDQNPDLKSPKG